jgi:hypothetical protein
MIRSEIIKRLVAEGFSTKTLAIFSDKQLEKLSNKLLNEAGLKVKADDLLKNPNLADKLKGKDVTVVPEGEDEKFVSCSSLGVKSPGMCEKNTKKPVELCSKLGVKTPGYCYIGDKQPVKKTNTSVNLKKLHEFVENTVNKNYHSLTTKAEISELIKEKFDNLSEKKMVDGLPEFMGEFDMAQPDVKPDVKPAPSKPDTDRPRREKPRHPGQRPLDPKKQPLPNPVPKAKAKEIGGEEAKSRVIKMINKIFTDN